MNCKEFSFFQLEKRGYDCAAFTKAVTAEGEFDSGWDKEMQAISQDQSDTPDSSAAMIPNRKQQRPSKRALLIAQFSDNYAMLFSANTESSQADIIINDLIDILGQLTTYVIYNRICSLPVYKTGDEEEIAQEGHIAAFEKLLEDLNGGIPRKDAIFYYLTIYKNKTKDYLSFYGLLKKGEKEGKNSGVQKKAPKKPKVSDIRAAQSIESMTANQEGEIQVDRSPWFAVNPFEDETEYCASQSRQILKIYIEELLNNTNIPPAPLAVMYARVLYQMERLLDADSVETMTSQYMQAKNWSENPADQQYDEHIIKATEAVQHYSSSTAPDWAISRMGKMTVFELEKDSEASLHKLFEKNLFWGDAFREKSASVSDKFAPLLWGAIVYTDSYKKPQVENWATDIHNATVVKAAKKICTEDSLLSYVLEELDEKGKLRNEVHKKQQKATIRGGVCR